MSTINLTLNISSINAAIERLKEYRTLLENNAQPIRQSVTDYLENLMRQETLKCVHNVFVTGDPSKTSFSKTPVKVGSDDDGARSYVIAHGKRIAFVEFGAGIHFNGPAGSYAHPNPPMGQGIVPIGEYGEKHGRFDSWKLNNKISTYGTPMQMPVQYSANYTADHIAEATKEAFDRWGGE